MDAKMYAKIAAAALALVLVGIAVKLWWPPSMDGWALLRMAHRAFLAVHGIKLAVMLVGACMAGASWLWFKFGPGRDAGANA